MVSNEEQKLIDAFKNSNDIQANIFEFRVQLSKNTERYSKEELKKIHKLIRKIQIHNLNIQTTISDLQGFYSTG